MVTQLTPGVDDQSAIMACIGYVCVQWALLENNLLGVLAASQNVTIDEAAILFGSLDMRPRLTKAIGLAEFHCWKQPLKKRLRDLRGGIDKLKMSDRRNMLIHGVHSESTKPQHFNLYSPRLSGDAQREEWSIQEAITLGDQVRYAAIEAHAIFVEYGRWKFGDNGPENTESQVVAVPAGLIARIKQHFSARTKGRWG